MADPQLRLDESVVTWREVDGEFVALDMPGSLYLAARDSAALLWRELAGGTTRARLVELLVERYGIDATRAGGDVDAYLADLSEHGYLA